MSRPIILGAAVLTAAVTAGNAWIFAHIQDGWAYEYASYATLNAPSDRPTIRDFSSPEPGILSVDLDHAGSPPWRVARDDGKESEVATPEPRLQLLDGVHRYTITPRAETSTRAAIRLGVWFTSAEALRRAGQKSAPDGFHVFSSSVPVGRFTQYPVEALARDPASLPAARAKVVRDRLVEEAGLRLDAPIEERLEKLGAFLVRRLQGSAGTPSDWMNGLEGDQQFEAAVAGKGKVYCKNFADIHQFYSAAIGVRSRRIATYGRLGVATLSAHALTEVWVPERGEWAAVDLVPRIFYVKNAEGRFMNTADLFHANVTRSYGGLTASVLGKDDAVHLVPYEEVAQTHQLYFAKDATLVYYFDGTSPNRNAAAAKIRRYALQPDLAYSLAASNTRHFVKMALIWSEPLLGLFWAVVLVQRLVRRRGRVAERAPVM